MGVERGVDVGLDAAVDGRGILLGHRLNALVLAAVHIGVDRAVQRVMAQEAVEIGLRDLVRRAGQPVDGLGKDGEQLVGLFAVQAVARLVERAARVDLVEEEGIGSLQTPAVGCGTQRGGALGRGREQSERLLAQQIMRYEIRHDSDTFLSVRTGENGIIRRAAARPEKNQKLLRPL